MTSREWQYFMDNFFGDPYVMWHDGIDVGAAARLVGDERERAEELLLESLEAGSHYAAMGLREMESNKAISKMRIMLKKTSSKLKIEIAVALNALEKTDKYVDAIMSVLRDSKSPYGRLDAAISLRRYNLPQVKDALFSAVCDSDYLVRYHASESLLYLHGLPAVVGDHPDIFKLICFEGTKGSPSELANAVKQYERATSLLRNLFNENAE